jgi:NADPH:quinone reductase-like Zn-dependent oxidoreductase
MRAIAIIDSGAAPAYATQLAAARGARVVATARPGAEADFVGGLGAAHTVDYADDRQEALDQLAADAAAGRLRVPITRTYPLAEVPQALAEFAAGALGKLAVSIG